MVGRMLCVLTVTVQYAFSRIVCMKIVSSLLCSAVASVVDTVVSVRLTIQHRSITGTLCWCILIHLGYRV